MPADLVPDDLWERVAPLLPARPARRHRYPGRLPVDDRAALRGIVYVLCKSVSWRDWTEAGVWPQLHEVLPAELRAAGLLDMDDAAIDGSHVAVAATGTPVVGVLSTGRPMALSESLPSLSALVHAYCGGQQGTRAVAQAPFGITKPGGKLPYSMPRHTGQVSIHAGQHTGSGYRRTESDMTRAIATCPRHRCSRSDTA